jgi:hypothetical protein
VQEGRVRSANRSALAVTLGGEGATVGQFPAVVGGLFELLLLLLLLQPPPAVVGGLLSLLVVLLLQSNETFGEITRGVGPVGAGLQPRTNSDATERDARRRFMGLVSDAGVRPARRDVVVAAFAGLDNSDVFRRTPARCGLRRAAERAALAAGLRTGRAEWRAR